MFCQAFAKINLRLRVTGIRQPSGYHELEMLNATVSLADEITLSIVTNAVHSAVTIECFGDNLQPAQLRELNDSEANVAARAASRYLQMISSTASVQIKIKKNIPLGGGLGGGSADAAAVLKLLNENFDALNAGGGKLDHQQLAALALPLGADIPYCLVGGLAVVRGIGEEITPVGYDYLTGAKALLVCLPIHSSTKEVFGARRALSTRKDIEEGREIAVPTCYAELLEAVENDLLAPFLSLHPPAEKLLGQLRAIPGITVGLSGSGSTFFVFPREQSRITLALMEKLNALGDSTGIAVNLRSVEIV